MTIYKAYLVALRATVTLTYIPVMTPGLYDKIPGLPEINPVHMTTSTRNYFGGFLKLVTKM